MLDQKKYNIVFMGTSDFAAPFLEALNKAPFLKISAVYCQMDRPSGRGLPCACCSVKNKAQELNLNIFQPLNFKEEAEIQKLKAKNPDAIIVASYGMILPDAVLDIPRFGCVNIHPSLLPCYRGATPIQQALVDGAKETGISIMLLDEKMDHGPLLAQEKLKIEKDDNIFSLNKKLVKLGINLLLATLPLYFSGKIKLMPQDHHKATFTKMTKKEDGKINWRESASQVERKIRAYSGWPASFAFWQEKRILVTAAAAVNMRGIKKNIGEVFLCNGAIHIQCGKGILQIKKLKLAGKKEMTAEEFLRGYAGIVGAVLR